MVYRAARGSAPGSWDGTCLPRGLHTLPCNNPPSLGRRIPPLLSGVRGRSRAPLANDTTGARPWWAWCSSASTRSARACQRCCSATQPTRAPRRMGQSISESSLSQKKRTRSTTDSAGPPRSSRAGHPPSSPARTVRPATLVCDRRRSASCMAGARLAHGWRTAGARLAHSFDPSCEATCPSHMIVAAGVPY